MNKKKYRLIFAVLSICLVGLSGCGGGDGGDSSTAQPTSQTTDISGTWKGTASSSVISGFVNITLTFTQSGSNISGTYACSTGSLTCLHSSGTISGTISGTSFTLSVVFPDNHSCGAFNGTITGSTMSGNYSCTDTAGNDNGSWSATKQSSKSKEALDQYYEALSILHNDDIDDQDQSEMIAVIENKILELEQD